MVAVLAVSLALSAAVHRVHDSADSLYEYRTERGVITMSDGVDLAVTWWIPTPRTPDERFPALLELLPYRKDDSFYARDFPLYDYFARRGFLLAKVDIRGTGSSAGRVPDREYSEPELRDAVEVIGHLARHPLGTGAVGMWGISWGGFNALQVARRRPPALKAILALHASDDLFHDDVHYIDGALHLDPYIVQIDHENGLPRWPRYALDSAYFRDRFEAYPWILTYLKQPTDGPFWRQEGLRFRPGDLQVPVYLIGGLLDGYRDTPIRALEYLNGPVKVEIGPWVHAWPDNGTPGPNYEWRSRAVAWWNHWLKGQPSPLVHEPRLLVFERAGHSPDRTRATTPGRWRFEEWPISGARRASWQLGCNGELVPQADAAPADRCARDLVYRPGFGVATGNWWGEPTGDLRPDDAGALTFDGPTLAEPLTLIGFPRVTLTVSHGAPLANWTARLEDVAPNGEVALVTGAVLNATQARSSVAPARLIPGANVELAWPLHFTTWVFRAGHRIRLAVSNAQFPMIWPTPYAMTSRVHPHASRLELPVAPTTSPFPEPILAPPEPRSRRADVTYGPDVEPTERATFDARTGRTSVEFANASSWSIGRVRYEYREREEYRTHDTAPWHSEFRGEATHRVRPPGRDFTLRTTIDITSDTAAFHVTFTRVLDVSGRRLRSKTWKESVPRQFH
jgi:hypothetical protein